MEREFVTDAPVVAPEVGRVVAFKPTASQRLAHIPGRIKRIVAQLNNGDYLVSLEYNEPVKFGDERVLHIDAFASHLYQPSA